MWVGSFPGDAWYREVLSALATWTVAVDAVARSSFSATIHIQHFTTLILHKAYPIAVLKKEMLFSHNKPWLT